MLLAGGMATRSHTFTQQGVYGAKLTVKDARGLVSSNTDMKMIEVTAAGGGGTSNPPAAAPSGRFGGAFGLALLPLAVLALRRRRQH